LLIRQKGGKEEVNPRDGVKKVRGEQGGGVDEVEYLEHDREQRRYGQKCKREA